MQRGLANHQYIIIRHSGTESKKNKPTCIYWQTGFPFRELYRDNWIGKGNGSRQRHSQGTELCTVADIGKANKAEIKEAMDDVLKKMQGFDLTKFKEELVGEVLKFGKPGQAPEKLNGYYVTARSGTEYKASEIGKATLSPISSGHKAN